MTAVRNRFSAGPRPLVGSFRSLFLNPDACANETDFSVPVPALADWIEKWDGWYMGCLHACNGGLAANRHLLYEREVLLAVPAIAGAYRSECIASVAAACRDLALGFALELPIRDDGDLAALGELIGLVMPWRMTLKLPDGGALLSATIWRETIDALARAPMQLHVAGPLDLIRSLATTSSLPLSSRAHGYRPFGATAVAKAAASGCGLRFGVFVAADGAIYPCRSLIGLRRLRLGSILDKIEDTALGGAAVPLDLASLARHGPGCDQSPGGDREAPEPEICVRHRRFLERAHRHGNSGSQG